MTYSLAMGSHAQGTLTASVSSIRYEFNVAAAGEYVIAVQAAGSGLGTLPDPKLEFRAYNGYGYSLTASDDDSGPGLDALTVAWSYAGWHAIDVSSAVAGQSGSFVVWYAPKAFVLMGATPGNDSAVTGTAGNDVIDGLAGADTMKGGSGDDTYYVDDAGDRVVELATEGSDRVYSSVSRTIDANVERLSLTGSLNLTATGNGVANTLDGNAGDNLLQGLGGNDTLYGGAGNDTLDGGSGADSLVGGDGDDLYIVDNTGDVIAPDSSGIDSVRSSVSITLAGGVEHLLLTGANNIRGTGNEIDNRLTGNAGDNVLTGNAGNDTLDGGAGADTLKGGSGDDTYCVDNAGDQLTDSAGLDTVYSSVSWTLGDGFERLFLTGSTALTGTGNALDNLLDASGCSGADTLRGGAGNDTYVLGAGDTAIEAPGQGTDLVITALSCNLGDTLENLTLTGSGNVNGGGTAQANALTGNAGNNVLTGYAGNDTLDGGAGADTLDGGDGDDTYCVDNLGDRLIDSAGLDTVYSSVSWTLGTGFERLFLTGAAAIAGSGNALSNVLDGSGCSGANVLRGGSGNDTYVLGASDTAVEDLGKGTDLVLSALTQTLGDNVENLALTGSADVNGTGNALDNVLKGNAGNNALSGGGGNDKLQGGAGADNLTGGPGNDLFVYTALTDSPNLAMGYDRIQDFSAGDQIDLHAVDANTTLAGDQDFSFIGTSRFGGHAGELRASGSVIEADVNGDAVADFYLIAYTQVLGYDWKAADFAL